LFTLDLLTLTGAILAIIHFNLPLIYYFYITHVWLAKPWNIKVNSKYRPKVTIIVPTYNEAKLIEKKLDNIYEQEYPRDRLEVIVIDSASTDGTPDIVKNWIEKHRDIDLKLIVESERRGKAHALNYALKHASGEVIVVTDVDSFWPRDALVKTVKYFADHTIGAVSCLEKPTGQDVKGVEESYRQYYNVVRVGESKAYATPIFHGELVAFRRELLNKIGGFPIDIGADDSHTATRIALHGYRAIIPEDIVVEGLVPRGGYRVWRIRRAQHLIQYFVKTLKLKPKTPRTFKSILMIEAFLHLLNPWILFTAVILPLVSDSGKRSGGNAFSYRRGNANH